MSIQEVAVGMRGVINTAALAQKDNGVKFEPFNQYLMGYNATYEDWLDAGMCRGLSIKYLSCLKSKTKFTDIVNAKSLNTFKFDKSGVYPYDNPLQDEILKASRLGNGIGDDKDFHDSMKETYKFKFDKKKSFTDARDAVAFGSETGTYSVIVIPGHAMAAVGLADKSKAFMEPNCGIVTGSKDGVLDTVENFFLHDFVQKTYRMTKPTFSFVVHSFKG